MSYRRKRLCSLPGTNAKQSPNIVDQLSFKYMEMCKVDSSTDSDSEISPRWSDTSTLGCANSAPERGTSRRASSLTHKPAGRHGGSSLFLDPYDGSSEDSEESGVDFSKVKLQGKTSGGGGGSRLLGRSRRVNTPPQTSFLLKDVVRNVPRVSVAEQLPMDVQMKCGCDSDNSHSLKSEGGHNSLAEERATEITGHTPTMELQCHSPDILKGISSVPHKPRSQPIRLGFSPKRSPDSCELRSVSKRKLGLPGADVQEQRKKQCVFSMEVEEVGQDPESKPRSF